MSGNSGKYDHIQLGRELRAKVKTELKALPGWRDYVIAQGWGGRTQSLTREEVIGACEALGYDLHAAALAHATNVVAAVIPTLTPDMTIAAREAALDDAMRKADEDDADEPASTPAASVEHESFEGRDAEELIADALASASVHMTPYLAGLMPGVLRPFVEAAVRGPRTVVQTVVQAVNAEGAPVSGFVAPHVNVTKQVPLWRAFDMRRSDIALPYKFLAETLMMDVCDYADAPSIDVDFFWQSSLVCDLAAQDAAGLNAWLYGAAGTGKTEGVKQYAARLGRPFVRIPIERTTEPAELIGQMVPSKGGGMEWSDGKLTRAMRIPRCVILIDEPTLLRSGTLAVLQTALDTRELYLVTGEVVKAAHGVFIVAADNTAGCGDDTGRYVDTSPVNAAFLDRFSLKTEVSFLTVAQETGMVSHRVGIHPSVARIMVDYASLTRGNADAGKLTMGVTTRRLLAWARCVKTGLSSAQAFNAAVIAGAAPEDKATLIVLEGQTLKSLHTKIDGIVRGTIDPNAQPVDPHAQGPVSSTGQSFPDDGDTL